MEPLDLGSYRYRPINAHSFELTISLGAGNKIPRSIDLIAMQKLWCVLKVALLERNNKSVYIEELLARISFRVPCGRPVTFLEHVVRHAAHNPP